MNASARTNNQINHLPIWIKRRVSVSALSKMENFIFKNNLLTVCQSALCPNRGECFKDGLATFLALGRNCTRNCRFCFIGKDLPEVVDNDEPFKIASAVATLGLKYVVITSVTRDDLKDGGAKHFAEIVQQIRFVMPLTQIELLVPDFAGKKSSIKEIIMAQPNVISHNLETVPRLYPSLRSKANYQRSLDLIKYVKSKSSIKTKSSLMLGLGEKFAEVCAVMDDLKHQGCDIITFGQYLAPSKKHFPVVEYIEPKKFAQYKLIAQRKKFKGVVSGPFVRSSYRADRMIRFEELA